MDGGGHDLRIGLYDWINLRLSEEIISARKYTFGQNSLLIVF
jgi:hypothetical protein